MVAGLPKELIVLTQASRALAQARTLEDIRVIRDKAEAARHYARSAALGLEIQNFAAELKLRAERKAGGLLLELGLWGGDRRSKSHNATLKLETLGVNRSQSARWQLEASVPDDVFEEYVSLAQRSRKELTAHGLMRLARKHKHKAGRGSPSEREERIDPFGPLKQPSTVHFPTARLPEHRQLVTEQLLELSNHFDLLSQTCPGSA